MHHRTKMLVNAVGLLLFAAAAICLFWGINGLHGVRPVSAYEDMGVHTFFPNQVTPASAGTGYLVQYRSTGTPNYKWQTEVSSEADGQALVTQNSAAERRVLSIPAENTYIVVPAEQTAETYTSVQQSRYLFAIRLSTSLLAAFVAAWIIIMIRHRKMRKQK